MFALQDSFREGPITQIQRTWFETVARALKTLSGVNISVTKPDNITPDTPIMLEVTDVTGVPGLLADGQTPLEHAASHQAGGADSIRLDDLAAAQDNTDLNASTGAHGLLPKLSGSSAAFLAGDGTWKTPTGTVPDGTVDGQVPVWDDTEETWVPTDPPETIPDGTAEGQVLAWGAVEGAWTPAVLDFKAGMEAAMHGSGSGWVYFNDATNTLSTEFPYIKGELELDLHGYGSGIMFFDDNEDFVYTVAPEDATTAYPKYLRMESSGLYWEDICDDPYEVGGLPVWKGGSNDHRLGVLGINGKALQVLRVNAAGTAMEWGAPGGVPSGTAIGQMLVWDTTPNPDAWVAIPAGTDGQLLVGDTGAKPAWAALKTALGAPATAADKYKVLQVTDTSGSVGWDFVRAH